MMRRVYIETSIPSFYYEVRQSPEMVARREWTRAWWETRLEYELVTSDAVFYIVNQMLGLFVPELVTPYQLLEEVQ